MSASPAAPAWRQRWPHLFLALRNLKYLGRQEPIDPHTRAVLAAWGGEPPTVQAGPFAGLRYLSAASGSALLPKLAGTYERELAAVVAATLGRGYQRVVNIGCGEGYYAVGYARALPSATVIAFDTDPLARQRTRQLAKLNGVAARVRVESACGAATLARALTGRSLVVCDCEGCELVLLDPLTVPGLAGADLIVELHDFLLPGLTPSLVARFEATHRVTLIDQQPRSRTDLPAALAAVLSEEQCAHTLAEGRPAPMQWAWLEARQELA